MTEAINQNHQKTAKPAESGQEKKVKEKKKSKNKPVWTLGMVIVILINILCAAFFLFLLKIMPKKALELNQLRNQSLKMSEQENPDVLANQLQLVQPQMTQIEAVFPDEIGILSFVKEIDKLKKEEVITRFSFVSDKPVKDKTKLLGLPIVIEFKGDLSQINKGLEKVRDLPFLIRAINIQLNKNADGLLELKYGGILYVSESFGEN